MHKTSSTQYDILVAGAGFAGSLTALILHNLGFKVCLLEKGQHPRFTIGESSTPVAGMTFWWQVPVLRARLLRSFYIILALKYACWKRGNTHVLLLENLLLQLQI